MTKCQSPISEAIFEMASDLHEAGAISDIEVARYEASCIAPVPTYTSEMVQSLRSRLNITQYVFASVLNTSASTVQKWETGAKKPSKPSCKLLHLLETKGLQALI